MPDGDSDVLASAIKGLSISEESNVVGVGPSCSTSTTSDEPKDPRKIARKYQLELCEKALEENVIVYLGTGCGKTHIAVLLMYEMRDLLLKPQENICVFLAPTVALVQQQARVIEESIDFKVGCYTGGTKRLRTHEEWQKEIDQHEVLVMTPEILLRNLSHCFIKMDSIALLIFDECHHAQVKSNHPYTEIMRVFYKADIAKRPRIFGMTASPIVGKGASDIEGLSRYINSLENLLNAKVYSVEDRAELDRYVASPVIRVYHYGPVERGSSSCYYDYYTKLEELKRQCISTLDRKNDDHQSLRNTKRMLNRMHENILFCGESLGLYGVLQACRILLSGDYSERNALIDGEGNSGDVSLCDRYLIQASKIFASNSPGDEILSTLPCLEILKEPWFSSKLLRLIGILSSFRRLSNMKCIIFVNRIVVARSLTYILQHLTILAYWKSDFLVGVHSGLRSMSRKNMKEILEKFRSGKLNLLVATKVGEEGLDIQTCCLVIRFDLPETVASFIQSRGRARMAQSEYAFLVDGGNQKELDLIESFKEDEVRMDVEIAVRTSEEVYSGNEDRIYKVDSSGASVSSGYSISLLHQYCAKLPRDEFFDPKPKIYYFDDLGGIVCQITFPANAPIHQVASTPHLSMEAARRDASLKAIEELHRLGALNDFLLCPKDDDYQEEVSSYSPECEDENSQDENSREELHEMLVPDALKEQWSCSDNVVLYSYYLEFCPEPADRTYKEFGLFLKAPLPVDAEMMNVDLHLARGRSVITKLVPSLSVTFDKDEIVEAQKFQEMFLKVILDRSDFISDPVILGKNSKIESGTATFYLLLPVILKNGSHTVAVDWKIIRRCLASPIFRSPTSATKRKYITQEYHVILANGFKSISEVENSLVYATHKKTFFFITNINFDTRGDSLYKDHEPLTHEEYIRKMFAIQLKYPEQPLLHAKPLFSLHNLLHNRKGEDTESQELEEYFIDLPPELCELKILGFSKDIGSSLSLLPSIMHRLENLLVAIQLKQRLSSAFPEGAGVHAQTILEALTTERCQERFSLERLEILGDAFLKFAVGRHLFLHHDMLDEGELTRRRSNAVNNSNLIKLAIGKNLQAYIRDQSFEPSQFFALGRPCLNICDREKEGTIHSQLQDAAASQPKANMVRCSRGHHWLHKKTIADVVEALVGAFIVDSGFKGATAFLKWIGIQADFEASQVTNACIASNHFLPLSDCLDIDMLETNLGYRFCHKGLLLQAFVHASYNKHGGGCYQRLEFLGDAVLDYLITSYIYSVYPTLNPGQLTDLRSLSVNNKSFAKVAIDRSFHKFLLHDSSSLSQAIEDYAVFINTPAPGSTHEEPKCPKVLGDLVESSVGAILLDKGFDLNFTWKIVLSFLDPVTGFSNFQLNPIRDMWELCQSLSWKLEFPTVKKGLLYTAEAKVSGVNFSAIASATNPNKREAIRMSAERLFADLKAQGYTSKTKPLEEILRSCKKGEAKLIGFDETPINVNVFGLNEQNSFNFGCQKNARETDYHSPSIVPLQRILHHSETSETSGEPVIKAETAGVTQLKSTKSHLYEVCTANGWRAPLFECYKEEGPGHSKMFSFKVVVTIEETTETVLECYGDPCPKKKAAAEHAAEGALWYLKHEGYID